MMPGALASKTNPQLEAIPNWFVGYRRGQVIFAEGDPATHMYQVMSGCVRLQLDTDDGSRQVVNFLFRGEMFGYAFDERWMSAEAVNDVVLRCWSINSILASANRTSDIVIMLAQASDQQFGAAVHHLEKVTHLSATDRLRWFFSALASCDGLTKADARIDLPMTHKDIADYLGLSAETFSRSLSELEGGGFLKRVGRRRFLLGSNAQRLKWRYPDMMRIAGS
jgi:CRP/FNR family transcriptional regulator, nitrogen fixation regulation protein